MADTITLSDKNREVEIYGFPAEQGRAAASQLYEAINRIDPNFKGTYQQAVELQMSGDVPGSAQPAPDILPPLPGQPAEEPGLPPLEGQDGGQARTDLLGSMGAMTRAAAPASIGALVGLPFGPVGSAVGASAMVLAEGGINLINGIFGTNWKTPSEAMGQILSRVGVAEPDTKAEFLLQNATRATVEAFSMSGLANMIGNVFGPGIATPNAVQGVAQQLAYNPVTGAVGAATGTYTGEGARQVAENLGGGLGWQFIAEMVGNMVGDATVGGPVGRMEARSYARNLPVPDDAQRSIDLTRRFDPANELATDELILSQRPTVAERTDVSTRLRTTGGTGDVFQERFYAGQDLGREFAEGFGVEVSDMGNARTNTLRNEALDMFDNARNGELSRATASRDAALASVADPNSPAVVGDTLQKIDAVRQDLLNQDPGAFSNFAKTLTDWEAALESGDITRIERQMRIIRDSIADTDMPAGIQREVSRATQEVYRTLRGEFEDFLVEQGGEETLNQWRSANRELQNLAEDFKDNGMKILLEEAEREPSRRNLERLATVITPDTSENMLLRMKNLLPEDAVQHLVSETVGNAFQKAVPSDFSPSKFADALSEYETAFRVLMSPEDFEYTSSFIDFSRRVLAQAEDVTRGGLRSSRLNLGENPTSGIVLSQLVRRLGLGVGYLFGDLLQGTAGLTARRFQRPEVRDMMASLRRMEPGSAAEAEMIKRLLRTVYNIDMDEAGRAAQEVAPNPRAYVPPSTPRQPAGAR